MNKQISRFLFLSRNKSIHQIFFARIVERIRLFFQDTRRQAAAQAADRRAQQSDKRGVNEDELRRMKQRQKEYPNSNNAGLRVSSSIVLLLLTHSFSFSGK